MKGTDNEYQRELATHLRELRRDHGVSASRLAELVGCSNQRISQIEGDELPSTPLLGRIIAAYSLPDEFAETLWNLHESARTQPAREISARVRVLEVELAGLQAKLQVLIDRLAHGDG